MLSSSSVANKPLLTALVRQRLLDCTVLLSTMSRRALWVKVSSRRFSKLSFLAYNRVNRVSIVANVCITEAIHMIHRWVVHLLTWKPGAANTASSLVCLPRPWKGGTYKRAFLITQTAQYSPPLLPLAGYFGPAERALIRSSAIISSLMTYDGPEAANALFQVVSILHFRKDNVAGWRFIVRLYGMGIARAILTNTGCATWPSTELTTARI